MTFTDRCARIVDMVATWRVDTFENMSQLTIYRDISITQYEQDERLDMPRRSDMILFEIIGKCGKNPSNFHVTTFIEQDLTKNPAINQILYDIYTEECQDKLES